MVSFRWKGKKKAGRVDLDKEESSNKVSSYLLATSGLMILLQEEFVEKTGLFPLVETDPSPTELDIE